MNLHAMARGSIGSVNPDTAAMWRRSTGYATDAAGKRTPTSVDVAVTLQVQKLSGRDLRHEAFQNLQAVGRSVYLFGNAQGVVQPEAKGGDLLLFPEVVGGPVRTWKVVVVAETWTPDAAGWSRVLVLLQL